MWLLFVDYTKTFDSVYHDTLWKALSEFGVLQHLIWFVKNFYDKATRMARLDDRKSNHFNFEKGVRQGCLVIVVSHWLFNVAGE